MKIHRRSFLAGTGALALGVWLGEGRALADSLTKVRGGDASPSLWIAIAPDGTVELTCHRSEMGQQAWTSMAQLIADELEADWSRVRIVQAEGHPRYGDQNTDGSRSVRYNFHRLRTAGAAMRALLVEAAARRWKVRSKSCRAELGVVIHRPSGRKLGYGDLAEDANKLPLPDASKVTLKKRSEWRYIGKRVPSLTVPKIIAGEAVFGTDVALPGMLHAVVARPPRVFAKVKQVDDSAARAVRGVVGTVELPAATPPAGFAPLGGVAVVARDTWAAIEGRKALRIDWEAGAGADYDSPAFAERLLEEVRKPGTVRRSRGDVSAALEGAKTKLAAEYYVPHLAHSPMEPPAAVARWSDDSVECWACVQAPQAARKTVAEACGVAEDKVTIRVTLLGGAFGRKSKPDFVAEAALIARAMKAPVKVTWTREDDLRHSYYHSVSAQRLEGGLDEGGACVALLHRTAFPTISSTFAAGANEPSAGELRLGASDTPFEVPNLQLESGKAEAPLRIGWLRSVCNIYHAFAVQSFANELAYAAGRDPKDYLLELIGKDRIVDPSADGAEYDNYGSPPDEYPIDTGRLAHVTEVAAEMAGWGRTMPRGHGLGIAAHRSFVTYVATAIEVAVDDAGRLTIVGVWSAMDAGTVVNLGHAESQMEGGTLFGLSNALYGAVTATGGVVDQSNFPDWRVMRMNESPRAMEVRIVESNAPPGGVGEPPTPPAAPALTNAIYAATGQRIRRLPIFGANRGKRLELPGAATGTSKGA